MKPYVRKIRPDDAGYDTVAAALWPWLAFGRETSSHRSMAFPTHKQALYYALTGERLTLGLVERAELRWRHKRDPRVVAHYAERRAAREARRAASAAR